MDMYSASAFVQVGHIKRDMSGLYLCLPAHVCSLDGTIKILCRIDVSIFESS
jgi:hypothetical protein